MTLDCKRVQRGASPREDLGYLALAFIPGEGKVTMRRYGHATLFAAKSQPPTVLPPAPPPIFCCV